MGRFEETKKYVFSREKFISWRGKKESDYTCNWAKVCDGKAVDIANKVLGYCTAGVYKFKVAPCWCVEVEK